MENNNIKICAYCGVNPATDSEHVVSKGLGGTGAYMDCVCDNCNGKFSTLERELMQKCHISIIRGTAGLGGKTPNKSRPSPVKGVDFFIVDEDSKIVYEVGQHSKFLPFLRPQLIEVNGEVYLELPEDQDLDVFCKAIKKWTESSKLLIELNDTGHIAIKFYKSDNGYRNEKESYKSSKNAILFWSMENNNRLYPFLTPRLFLDDENNLRLRAKSLQEGIAFMERLLVLLFIEKKDFSSRSHNFPPEPIVEVNMNFDHKMVERALVKIGLNCLMHYYPETQYSPLLADAKAFVLDGKGVLPNPFDEASMDMIDKLPDTHCILFIQQAQALKIRINLFEGQFLFSFALPDVFIQPVPSTTGVDINYRNKTQQHETINGLVFTRRQAFSAS